MGEINLEKQFAAIGKGFMELMQKERLASYKELNKRAQKGGGTR
jgi:hypothetical protein